MMTHDTGTIGPGDRVRLHFAMTLEDGTEAESTFGDQPVEITIGQGDLQASLEARLTGLRPGERRRFAIAAQEGFGAHDPALIHMLSRREFPPAMELEPGLIIGFTTPAGDEVPGLILDIQGDEVTVDFNHPLAGRDFEFRVEILSVQPGPSTRTAPCAEKA